MGSLKVGIVGAGASGLVALKTCLEEGFQVVCFEKSSGIGGWWRFSSLREGKEEEHPGVAENEVSRSSREMLGFSDFPFASDAPQFLPHRRLMDCLRRYSTRFNLRPHIRFSTKVLRLHAAEDFERSGRWIVRSRDNGTFKVTEEEFDAVIICNGLWNKPYNRPIPGSEELTAKISHVIDYRNPESFRDKRVLVVSNGVAGTDIALDISSKAAAVFLSLPPGSWVRGRLGKNGKPFDLSATTRLRRMFLDKGLPYWLFSRNDLTLVPGPRRNVPIVADNLMIELQTGRVAIRPEVVRLSAHGENSVYFEGGLKEFAIDCIIYDTGYRLDLPFDNFPDDARKLKLHKYIFPSDFLPHPTLALIGAIRANDGGDSLALPEIQARYICYKLKEGGKIAESDAADWEEIDAERRFPISIDAVGYMEGLAEEMGVKPPAFFFSQLGILSIDWGVLNGPFLPTQYRLRGPHAWKGAREHLRDFRRERKLHPVPIRVPKKHSDSLSALTARQVVEHHQSVDSERRESEEEDVSRTMFSLARAILLLVQLLFRKLIPDEFGARKLLAISAICSFFALLFLRIYYASMVAL